MFPVSHGESENTDRTGFFKDAVVERKRLLVEFRGFPRVFFLLHSTLSSLFFHLFFLFFCFQGLLASSGSRAAESQQPSGSDGEGTEGEELSELG